MLFGVQYVVSGSIHGVINEQMLVDTSHINVRYYCMRARTRACVPVHVLVWGQICVLYT